MLQEKLKENTRAQHDRLEQLMLVDEIMNRTITLPQYRRILTINFLTHRDYEEVLLKSLGSDLRTKLDVNKRIKLPALELDLLEAGLNNEDLNEEFKPFGEQGYSESFAIGAMYVLEGATLGGNVIQKQLAQNPNFNEQIGLHYYRAYGKDLMVNWKAFVSTINSLPDDMHEEAIDGANFMFSKIADIAARVQVNF